MLAFTVQFSRYGRNKGPLGASAPRGPRPSNTLILCPPEGITLTSNGKIRVLVESAPYKSGCFLRTQQRAHPARRSVRSFRKLTEVRSVLAAPSRVD
jgi:hypothetical protein